jgi:hypothetical protein
MGRLERRLRELVAEHGIDAVRSKLDRIGENKRTRGRPRGPQIDDGPKLQAAAELWRNQDGKELGSSVWSFLKKVADSPAEAHRLNRRLRPRVFADLLRLHELQIDDFLKVAVGDDQFMGSRKVAAEIDALRGLNQTFANVRSLCLTAMLNCSDDVDIRKIRSDCSLLLSQIGDCEVYEAEFDRLLGDLREELLTKNRPQQPILNQ